MLPCATLVHDSRSVRNSFHGNEVSALLHRRTYTGACAYFAGSVACHGIQTGVLSTMHGQVFSLNRCCVHQRTHLRTRSLQLTRKS